MNRLVKVLMCVVFVCVGVSGFALSTEKQAAEISFTYEKQRGYSSNQFAIWVEDGSGAVVKTLYVTKFTAKKGFKTRPESLSEWVSKTNPSVNGLDAASGATPKAGRCAYAWDFTDASGKKVSAGTYVIRLEATLYRSNALAAFATVTVADDGSVQVGAVPVVIEKRAPAQADQDKNNDMISNVSVTVR